MMREFNVSFLINELFGKAGLIVKYNTYGQSGREYRL